MMRCHFLLRKQGPGLTSRAQWRCLSSRQTKIADPAAHFKGKFIRVTGMVVMKDNQPQIEVDDPIQIEIVDGSN
jgi:hypothetical protein